MNWKLQANKRKGSGGRQGGKGQAGCVYLGGQRLALGASLFWQRQLSVCWGRASQTANERFSVLALPFPSPVGGDREPAGHRLTSLNSSVHVSVRLGHSTTPTLLPREPSECRPL